MILALERDLVTVAEEGRPVARLRPDRRRRPLVLRGNVGDELVVEFTSRLPPLQPNLDPATGRLSRHGPVNGVCPGADWPCTRTATIPVHGVPTLGADDRARGPAPLAPRERQTYRFRLEREGAFLSSLGAPAGGEGDGGSLVHGLFGVIVVEPAGSRWFESQVGPERLAAARAAAAGGAFLHYDAADSGGRLAMLAAFREFVVVFHDELKTFYPEPLRVLRELPEGDPDAILADVLQGVRDGFAINDGASGMGAALLANRKGFGPAKDCVECAYEAFFRQSWADGDPALLPTHADHPSNVHDSDLGDPVVFCNLHAGPKETRVFHPHAHQWLAQRLDDSGMGGETLGVASSPGNHLDSQTIAPLQLFSHPIHCGGSGTLNSPPATRSSTATSTRTSPRAWGALAGARRVRGRQAPAAGWRARPGSAKERAAMAFHAGRPASVAMADGTIGQRVRFVQVEPGLAGDPNVHPPVKARVGWTSRTPTDTVGQHIHLVKFDVLASDGSANGFNYEDGTFAREAILERVRAASRPGGAVLGGSLREPAPGEYQVTIQRWWADPLLWGPPDAPPGSRPVDKTLRTVFTHDHFAPSSIQQHGFYSALLVEPAGSTWWDRVAMRDVTNRPGADGVKEGRGVGTQVRVTPPAGAGEPLAEFALAIADFALLYEPCPAGTACREAPGPEARGLEQVARLLATRPPRLLTDAHRAELALRRAALALERPIAPPKLPEAISTDHHDPYLLNDRNEPLPLRIGERDRTGSWRQKAGIEGDLAAVFSSLVHGRDPATEIPLFQEGERLQLRVIQGAQEVQHVLAVQGLSWPREPNDPGSFRIAAQEIGISEHFELDLVMPGVPDGVDRVDLLYEVTTVDALWNGAWGLLRVHRGDPTATPA